MRNKLDEVVDEATRRLIAEGKIIQAGWVSYRRVVMPANCSAVQVDETRKAFYAGAQHLIASMMRTLDPGEEPTSEDLARMDHIHAELAAFGEELARSISKGSG